MAGLVTQTLAARLRAQLDRYGVVVLFDQEQHYEQAVDRVDLGDTPIERYDGSFFALRRRLEPYLSDRTEPPRLLVYVPMAESATRHALCEVAAAGIVMRPGKQPPALNTRLAVIARAALAGAMPADAIEPILRQAEEGTLSLADLDQIAERGREAHAGALALVFGTTGATEVALRFLSDRAIDAEIDRRGALPSLVALLGGAFGVELDPTRAVDELRHSAATYLLATELSRTLDEPSVLRDVPHASDARVADACVELVATWRNRRDLQEAYVQSAREVDEELRLDSVAVERPVLERCETLASLDRRLAEMIERELIEAASEDAIEVAERRQGAFWSIADAEVMKRWALLASIGRVRVSAKHVGAGVAVAPGDPRAMVRAYREGAGGVAWSTLDTHQRHMEARYHQFDLDHSSHTTTETLIARAREDYTRVAAEMTERFGEALLCDGLKSPPLPRQLDTFRRYVDPLVRAQKRVAYVLVDGLRYEMGEELQRSFGPEVNVELEATLGVLPSITEVGMVALLPRADEANELVGTGKGRIAVALGGKVLRTRKDRMSYFEGCIEGGFLELKLDDILPPRGRTKTALKEAAFVCVTATDELDGLCEKGNVAMARRLMDDVILQVRRAIRVLFDVGIERVVVTADHGFLFGESLDEGSKIDPPGGETLDLHRRVWIGRGGAASGAVYRLKASDVGLGGDLEIVVPRGVGAFRSGGRSTAYFHGGASMQELIVPVLQVSPGRPSTRPSGSVTWSLALSTRVISSWSFSVQVRGTVDGLFGAAAPLVRIEALDGRRVVSRAVAASYGFDDATGLVQLRTGEGGGVDVNTTTLVLLEAPKAKTLRVVMYEADSEKVLAALDGAPISLADR